MILSLINHTAVLTLIAYILTRTQFYTDIIEKKFTIQNRCFLIIIFGIFSIYGSLSGIQIHDTTANIRDLGPLIAGLLAGPIVGIGAGLIGGIHRLFLGGCTRLPCTIATISAGLIAGLIYHLRQGKLLGIAPSVLLAVLVEIFHMGLVLLLTKPFSTAISIVHKVYLPMTIANAIGMMIFLFFTYNLMRERETQTEKEKIESELRVAHDIQMGIIPKLFPAFPHKPEFILHAVIKPAKEVGGDLYVFFLIDDDHLCFTIADVSGKGVPASLFMAVTKTLIKAKTYPGITPDAILYEVNEDLCEENESAMFVTTFCAILNIRTGELQFSNGGHNLPYLIHDDEEIEQFSNTKGIALGVMPKMEFGCKSIHLKPGDICYLYTDGVNEAMNERNELYDYSRLENFLQNLPSNDPKAITTATLHELKKFSGNAIQSDDITILVMKYNGVKTHGE